MSQLNKKLNKIIKRLFSRVTLQFLHWGVNLATLGLSGLEEALWALWIGQMRKDLSVINSDRNYWGTKL
jgi:hypothetical protein